MTRFGFVMRILSVLALALSAPSVVAAETRYTLAATAENHLFLAQAAFGYRNDRWSLYSSLAASQRDARVQETYVGLSLGALRLTAGKKAVRWGTGFAFTPTGVLDPPRVPTDITDRLGRNEGREMVKLDWVRGRHALSGAATNRGLQALRYNVVVRGFDASAVASRRTLGAGFSRVIGDAWELHGEVARSGTTHYLIGAKHTTRAGLTTIVEFFSPPRRHVSFLRVAKSRLRDRRNWKLWDAAISLVVDHTGGQRVAVVDVECRLGRRFTAYGRSQTSGGARVAGPSRRLPYTSTWIVGLRFQM